MIFFQIIEYPELGETLKNHQSPAPIPAQRTPPSARKLVQTLLNFGRLEAVTTSLGICSWPGRWTRIPQNFEFLQVSVLAQSFP